MTRTPYNPKGISKLPDTPGAYEIGCNNESIRIGHSKDTERRVKEHHRDGMPGCDVTVHKTKSKKQAMRIEKDLISDKCPPANEKKPDHCKNESAPSFEYRLAISDARILLLKHH